MVAMGRMADEDGNDDDGNESVDQLGDFSANDATYKAETYTTPDTDPRGGDGEESDE